MESIMATEKGTCFLCGKHCPTEEHHIFYGTGNRKLSERFGLKVDLCHSCHNEPPNGVHFNSRRDQKLKEIGQVIAMKHYGWSEERFIQTFGRNYL